MKYKSEQTESREPLQITLGKQRSAFRHHPEGYPRNGLEIFHPARLIPQLRQNYADFSQIKPPENRQF
jgi:hypothetical protein